MKNELCIVVPVFLCLFGCSALKKENLNVKQVEATNLKFVSESASFTQKNTMVKDSLNTIFEIEIWPQGKFLLSEKGFEGEATKIWVSRKTDKLREASLQEDTKITEKLRVNQAVSTKLSNTKLLKSRSIPPFSLLIFLAVVLLVIFLFWLWFERKRLLIS